MKIALHGATGRMGLALVRLIHQAEDLTLVGAACRQGDPAEGRDVGELAGVGAVGVVASCDTAAALLGADCVIDFSLADAVPTLMALCQQKKIPVVSGTTNFTEAGQSALESAAKEVPVLWAPNMSLGIQVLAEVVQHAIKRLGLSFDIEVVEPHHRRKVDAPSGTAKRLAKAVKEARSGLNEVHGREGQVGARKDDEMGMLALRGGDVVGDHTVHLFGEGERLELTHRATSRDLFAAGALRAARFLASDQVKSAAPRLYSIADVLS